MANKLLNIEGSLQGKVTDYNMLMFDPQAVHYIAKLMHSGKHGQKRGNLLQGSGMDVEDAS